MNRVPLVALIAVPLVASAYEPERARDNFAHEATECAAYFMLISALPGVDEVTSKKSRQIFEDLIKVSAALSSEEVTKARFELAQRDMFKKLDGKASNISIVSVAYAEPCVSLKNNPEARMKFWLDKK